MAQNISLLGAEYSAVPSVLLPKTGGGTASFTDVTDTTAAAADVAAGKYFYTASGVRTLGTGSGGGGGGSITQDQDGYLVLSPDGGGGGGGLEYEEGTWTPSADVAEYTISFSNTHSTAPFFYCIIDATNTYDGTLQSNNSVTFVDWNLALGATYYLSTTSPLIGLAITRYRASNATNDTGSTTRITNRVSAEAWATNTGIKAYSSSTSNYWRAGRTYKWIAVWSPTT